MNKIIHFALFLLLDTFHQVIAASTSVPRVFNRDFITGKSSLTQASMSYLIAPSLITTKSGSQWISKVLS